MRKNATEYSKKQRVTKECKALKVHDVKMSDLAKEKYLGDIVGKK